jgi:RimJ/RimL family protein N-acetyltransferase
MADYTKHGFGRWVVALKTTGEMVGWAGLKFLEESKEVDIGYRLLSEFWGKGYATEASRPCIEYGFKQLGLNTIIAFVLPDNSASFALPNWRPVSAAEHFGLTHRKWIATIDWNTVTFQPLRSSDSP